ncbi:hypothetical protein [Paraflavitalea speifideaquila]|uniref:hypothetical protein n=1 Tax=Paraflavitalea speifideaquila TaxID=3076558 RepID=UPI0028ED6939|nr:hypothetical protein [Paraflavitalea speifideiaquila]
MKKILLIGLIVLLGHVSYAYTNSPALDSVPAQEKDVKSIDAILTALYDVISGPAGQTRNWDRMRTLFLPEGRLVATGIRPDGTTGKRVMSVEDYIKSSGPYLEKMGFLKVRSVARQISLAA